MISYYHHLKNLKKMSKNQTKPMVNKNKTIPAARVERLATWRWSSGPRLPLTPRYIGTSAMGSITTNNVKQLLTANASIANTPRLQRTNLSGKPRTRGEVVLIFFVFGKKT